MAEYSVLDVPVEGGSLRVGIWGARGPVVFACHGITANHISFQALADELVGELRLIAPDLRGRGRSNAIAGPWGMHAHAADVIAVLDHLQLSRADLLLGHSMGGFVAAVAAAEYPQRIGPVLMVDGGLPLMKLPPLHRFPFGNFLIEKLVQSILGPSLNRLGMTFASRDAYRDFWRVHPALRDEWSAYVQAYVDYDLVGEVPELRASTAKAAVMTDVQTQLIEDVVPKALEKITMPIHFLRAPRGLMNGKPLYPPAKLAKAGRKLARFQAKDVEDVNHYSIVISERGAKAVAAEIRSMLGTYASA